MLILEDGIRTGDLSGESGDHGVAVDPNGAERIEIVRGPATLLYGSNAVGGLVNVITPHESYRASRLEGTRGQMSADLGSANAQAGANAALQHTRNGVHFWAAGDTRRSEDYTTPEGIVENSATESSGARAGVGWSRDRLFASAGVTLGDGRYGVPVAGEFHGHHEEEPGGFEDDHHGETAIALDWQRQAFRFDVGLQSLSNRVVEGVQLSLNVIDWNHNELEIEGGSERVGNHGTTTHLHPPRRPGPAPDGRLSGGSAPGRGSATSRPGASRRWRPDDLASFRAFAYEELATGPIIRLQLRRSVDRTDYPDSGAHRRTRARCLATTMRSRPACARHHHALDDHDALDDRALRSDDHDR